MSFLEEGFRMSDTNVEEQHSDSPHQSGLQVLFRCGCFVAIPTFVLLIIRYFLAP